jgi:hypothetical protein
MLLFSCFFCGCVPDRQPKECLEETNQCFPALRGYLSNDRYFSEDRTFSVSVEGLDIYEAEILENKDDVCTSAAFSFYSGLTIRYDMFPIVDLKMLFALCETGYRNEFFKIFLNQVILSPFRNYCPSIEISVEEVVSKEDESFYFGLIHGPISRDVNSATGQRSIDYAGILIGLKGQNILVIQLQKGSEIFRCQETAEKELLPRLLYFYENCLIESSCQESCGH